MAYQTFFEIGGHVIESYVEQQGQPSRPAINPLLEKGRQMGIPKPLIVAGSKELKESTGVDLIRASRAAGRGKRAGWALRTAAALALVDGPLPMGDAIAAGLLVTYAGYEIVSAGLDVKEGLGY